MEVHHHAYPAPAGHRRKCTHYLWEFLMLFLAVYLGFLAENIREHKTERKRGHEYLVSFYEDLKTDTANLNRFTRGLTRKIEKLVPFRSCYDSLLNGQRPVSFLDIMKNSLSYSSFLPEKRRCEQYSRLFAALRVGQQFGDHVVPASTG